ncbi:MAG: SDR family oxidoreductase [Deltaproteobacteria bacterium]|nr:SDR family oxidoreductase [Deltaproteobacteria bacterium]
MKLQDLFSLKGKVAIVTGGGRGIGRFIATGLAEAGADIVITSRKMKNLEAAAEEISKEYGVVNNAGATWGAPTLEFPLEKWDYLFNVNVRGVWIMAQKVATIMKEQGGGNIINISSVMGLRGSDEMAHPAIPYNSTKAAVNLLTMNLAVKLAPHNIRVNAIAPGFFGTDMMAYIEQPEFKEAYEATLNVIPMHRLGRIDDMKGVAAFLASDASAFMTGHILINDGGQLAK